MKITLTLDDDVVEQARTCTEQRQTTLAAMVAELLQQEIERQAAIEAWGRRTRETAGRSEPGWRLNRDEVYDRPILK